MCSIDDPKEVEKDLKRPVINSWTENDPPDEMVKKEPRRKATARANSPAVDKRTAGMGRPPTSTSASKTTR